MSSIYIQCIINLIQDFEAHSGKSEYEDLVQAVPGPSTMKERGHQNPAAFLIMASGLDAVLN